MSVRSDLRAEAMVRDGGVCVWPGCELHDWIEDPLEMAHIVPVGSGGPDVIENVVMLCRWHHNHHDGRQRRSLYEYRRLLLSWVALRNGYDE